MSAVSVVQVGVQAEPCDLASWTALARRLESDGFAALLVGDHPASGASPWTALGAAAVTDTLGVGTYVLNTGVRDPVRIAAEAATLNLLAPGRVHLGLGAGHTPGGMDPDRANPPRRRRTRPAPGRDPRGGCRAARRGGRHPPR